jgi:hypothetical protein
MARNTSPEHQAYSAAARAVREGDESPAALARLAQAEAVYEASKPAPAPQAPGWWNIPAAASCWAADASLSR